MAPTTEDSEGLRDQLRRKILSNVSRVSSSRLLVNYDEDSVTPDYARNVVAQDVGKSAGEMAQVSTTDETSRGFPSRRVEATLWVVQDPEKLRDDVTQALVTAQEMPSRARNKIGLKWQDPPAPQNYNQVKGGNVRGQGAHAQVAAQLRKHPGRWALVLTAAAKGNSSYPALITGAKFSCYEPAGSFEAVSRSNGDGLVDIYVRYVGEGN